MLRSQPCNGHGATGGAQLQCARARVPLDYDHPSGTTIQLNLSRLKADPAPGRKPIGTLFVNPGGPGGPAADIPGVFARLLGSSIHTHFDVVGIDPRGIGGSTPVRCRIPEHAPPYVAHAFPMTVSEVNRRSASTSTSARPAVRAATRSSTT